MDTIFDDLFHSHYVKQLLIEARIERIMVRAEGQFEQMSRREQFVGRQKIFILYDVAFLYFAREVVQIQISKLQLSFDILDVGLDNLVVYKIVAVLAAPIVGAQNSLNELFVAGKQLIKILFVENKVFPAICDDKMFYIRIVVLFLLSDIIQNQFIKSLFFQIFFADHIGASWALKLE